MSSQPWQHPRSPIPRPSESATAFVGNSKGATENIHEMLNRHESSVYELQSRLATKSDDSEQVRLLRAIHGQLAMQSTPLQFIWNSVLQTIVVAMAFLFGMFSIFSWHGQIRGNNIAGQANQISLLALCLSSNTTTGACKDVTNKIDQVVAYYFADMNSASGAIDVSSGWPWPVHDKGDLTIFLVYILTPVVTAMFGFLASWRIYQERGRHFGGTHI